MEIQGEQRAGESGETHFSLKKISLLFVSFLKILLFIRLFLAVLSSLLCRLFLVAVHGLLIAVASLVAKHRL